MAAIVQLHQKYSRWILLVGLVLATVYVVFQINLPALESQLVTATSQSHHKHQYNIFTVSSSLSTVSEVPRHILGSEINYIINNPLCDTVSKRTDPGGAEIFMLILITSHVGDTKTRRRLREILPQSLLDGINAKRLFLLAKPPPSFQTKNLKYADVTMNEIAVEQEEFHDILMGDFHESYKHLTYKHLMGLEWAATFCQNAKFVLKQDDDIAVDYFQLRDMLTSSELGHRIASHPFIFGKVLENQPVIRDPESKWFVNANEYPYTTYPSFVSGWAYVTTISTIQELIMASETARYFFIDDAFITGILREATPVSLIDMGDYFTQYRGQLLCCVSKPEYAKSKKNEPFWCDYIAGPSNDDMELMEIYQRHSQFCHISKSCRRREESELLSKKCVITENMKVHDFSQNQISHGPSPAVIGKPLPVIRKQ